MGMDIRSVVRDFIAELDIMGRSRETIRAYANTLYNFLRFCVERLGIDSVESIEEEHVREWFKYLRQAKHVSHRSLARHHSALKQFFNIVLRKSFTLPVPKYEEKLPDVLDPETVRRMIETAGELEENEFLRIRNKTMLLLAFDCALRLGELIRLNVDDVVLEQGLIIVRGKGGTHRAVPLIEDYTKAMLKKYLEIRNQLFPDKKALFVSLRGERIHPNTVKYVVNKVKRALGIDKRRGIHLLRHSRATYLLLSGWNLREVQEFLRHKRIATTTIYTHITQQYLQQKARQTKKLFE